MIMKKGSKRGLKKTIFGCFFVIIGIFFGTMVPLIGNVNVSAVTEGESSTETNVANSDDSGTDNEAVNNLGVSAADLARVTEKECQDSLGSVAWSVCPIVKKAAEATDWLYNKLEDILLIKHHVD